MAKLTAEYRVAKCNELIGKLEYAIDKATYNLKAKKAKVKAYYKKLKVLEKEISASAPKVVNIKRGRKTA